MGKSYKRKTRWRTLNIAAPPGEEDEEEGTQNPRENGTRSFQSNHKPFHTRRDSKTENCVGANDSAGESPSRSQSKIMFDESEYTRITTPRQDMLFKKGYLARKMVWSSNNVSTSATPSTTESQSASHSTADGSEIIEDQQLLDCHEGYPSITESTAQMSFGTFYDHVSGYYYEYPVMMVGPSVPGPPMHNLVAAMPCEAVPLRPIEWVNSAFVPKLEQPYCLIDYQNQQMAQQFPPEENGIDVPSVPCTNDTTEVIENGNGNGSWRDGVVDEEEKNEEEQEYQLCEVIQNDDECNADPLVPVENGLETVLAQQLHVSHHVVPPQPYMYPAPYMFGPALINVNGIPIQSGPMVRNPEMAIGESMYNKRRNKKKLRRRKSRHPPYQDVNGEYGQDEEDYSSEAENPKFVLNTFASCSRPLNPDCKEFQLRPMASPASSIVDPVTEILETKNNEGESSAETTIVPETKSEITEVEYALEAIANDQSTEESQETEVGVDAACGELSSVIEAHEIIIESNCQNSNHQGIVETIISNGTADVECQRLPNGNVTEKKFSSKKIANPENHKNSKVNGSKSNNISKKKYKTNEFVREATPGPVQDNPITVEVSTEVSLGVEAIELQLSKSSTSTINSYADNKINNSLNEDSGFESQTRYSRHPITDAVTQWLRRTNSPELFVGLRLETSDDEEDEPDDLEPSKNLQGNPMPALSSNSVVNDVKSSRPASEFVTRRKKRISNKRKKAHIIKQQQCHYQQEINESDDENCEFTRKDSVVGMRVAESTRIDIDNKVEKDNYRTKSIKSSRDDEEMLLNTDDVNVDISTDLRTFEKGEIITIDRKLSSGAIYGTVRCYDDEHNSTENKSQSNLIGNIEEPDILEYWDVETVEPINADKFIDRRCSSFKDDQVKKEVDLAGLQLVRKYYRFAHESVQSGSSIDENDAKSITTDSTSRLLSPEPINAINFQRENSLTVSEAIEIYKSCYNSKPQILIDCHMHKSRLLHGHYGDRPIPCQAACCNVQ